MYFLTMPDVWLACAPSAATALPQVLMQLLKEAPFHVRKECAYAVANICAGGGGGTGDLEALNWLFSADRWGSFLSLYF